MSPDTRHSTFDVYSGRHVTVMGLGRFGGGVGAVRFLAEHGARVTLTDILPAAQLTEPLAKIRDLPLSGLRLGEHREEDFTAADLVVASPAVRPDHPCLAAARARGIDVTTEIGLFCRHCPARIIGVTGTVGKSSTVRRIASLLECGGIGSAYGGNLGGSLLGRLPDLRPADWVVLEISSFQLMYLDADRFSPAIAVVTNFFPNHLDWHQSVDEYREAKQTLLRHQRPGDVAVLPSEGAARDWPARGRRIEFGHHPESDDRICVTAAEMQVRMESMCDQLPWEAMRIGPGEHQRLNVAAAVTAALAAGLAPAVVSPALAVPLTLPHRMEYLGCRRGRHFYNDSKATTPESAIAALQSFDQPLIVLAGGSDKGVDLGPLAVELARRAKAVALMGQTGPRLGELITAAAAEPARPALLVPSDFDTAFAWAMAQSVEGDTILLSPGCASFGWFRDYADRGDRFRALTQLVDR